MYRFVSNSLAASVLTHTHTLNGTTGERAYVVHITREYMKHVIYAMQTCAARKARVVVCVVVCPLYSRHLVSLKNRTPAAKRVVAAHMHEAPTFDDVRTQFELGLLCAARKAVRGIA